MSESRMAIILDVLSKHEILICIVDVRPDKEIRKFLKENQATSLSDLV